MIRTVAFSIFVCLFSVSVVTAWADNIPVATYHFNNQRTGWNSHETLLTPANVNPASFGLRWRTSLHADIAGWPLYVPNEGMGGHSYDVVYAATTRNDVYALDAANGHILWGPTHVANAISDVAFIGGGDLKHPNGILSTPVIDLKSNTIYVCALFQPKIQQLFGFWAIDLSTGKIRHGWPRIIHGSYLGCEFNGGQILQRGALLLDNGWVYAPFGARQDRPDWHGWIVGVNAKNPSAPLRMWSPDPQDEGGGIWGVGGPSADDHGNMFVVMGNGGNNYGKGGFDIGQAVVRLKETQIGTIVHYNASNAFMPNNVQFLNDTDEDLGGGGGVLLPPIFPPSATSQMDRVASLLLTTGGKEGKVYLLDRNNLGGVGHSLFEKLYFGNPAARDLGEIRAVPAYFDAGSAEQFLFYPGEDPGVDGEHGLVGLKIMFGDDNRPSLQQVWTLKTDLQRPASPAVSSNGSSNAIVWDTEPDLSQEGGNGPGSLRAYDALTGKELYTTNQNVKRDALPMARKFAGPMVVDGKVFVGVDGVACYGLLGNSGVAK